MLNRESQIDSHAESAMLISITKAIMENAGSALVGIGLGSGQDRAMAAVTQAVNSPLLEVSIEGAKGVLFGVSELRI